MFGLMGLMSQVSQLITKLAIAAYEHAKTATTKVCAKVVDNKISATIVSGAKFFCQYYALGVAIGMVVMTAVIGMALVVLTFINNPAGAAVLWSMTAYGAYVWWQDYYHLLELRASQTQTVSAPKPMMAPAC